MALIVEIEDFVGSDTWIQTGGETDCGFNLGYEGSIFMIVNERTGEVLDNGYRSHEEAKEA